MSHLIDGKFVTPYSTTIFARHFQSISCRDLHEEVALERLIEISTQFPVSQGVTWEETAEV